MARKTGRTFISVCLAALLLLQGSVFRTRADAGDLNKIIGELGLLAGELGALLALETYGLTVEQDILDTVNDTYDLLQETEKRDKENYALDHEALENGYIVWSDQTDAIRALYGKLSAAGALSFAETVSYEKFKEQNPGYRNAPDDGYIDFSKAYKDRIGQFQRYAYGVVSANNDEAHRVVSSQTFIKKLNDASLAAGYYRKLSQASDQIANFTNQTVSNVRIDIQRQIESQTVFTLNARQERADAHASFKQAVTKWKGQSNGRAY
ncbi:MAG: hypothetical protein LBQ19_05625 [Synergistaceae bacterium]|nr:hypothetical protein [Synergistaceae bacterium]